MTTAPNQKLSSNIAELRFDLHHEHHLKLSAILDLYGGVLGFNISDIESTISTLKNFNHELSCS